MNERDPQAAPELLTPDDVERLFQIKRGTQKSLRRRRQMPFLQLGGGKLIRYRRSDIEAWLESRSVPVEPRTNTDA